MINQYPVWKYALMEAALPVDVVSALSNPTLPAHRLPDVR